MKVELTRGEIELIAAVRISRNVLGKFLQQYVNHENGHYIGDPSWQLFNNFLDESIGKNGKK